MAKEKNLVLEQIRLMRSENQELHRDLGNRMDRVEKRLNSVEMQVAGLRSDFASYLGEHYTLEKRVERIERRLELRDDA